MNNKKGGWIEVNNWKSEWIVMNNRKEERIAINNSRGEWRAELLYHYFYSNSKQSK